MAGTVKLCVPELALLVELDGCGELDAWGELVARAEFVGCAEAVAETEGSTAAAECARVGEADGVGDELGVPAGAAVGEPAETVPDPLVSSADAMGEGGDPLAPHAARLTPPMMAAMITAGTRHLFMLISSAK
jgi:hypothetical protein